LYLRRVEEEADSLIPYMCGVYIQKRPMGAAARAEERHVGGGGAFGKDPECGDAAREGDGAGVKERSVVAGACTRPFGEGVCGKEEDSDSIEGPRGLARVWGLLLCPVLDPQLWPFSRCCHFFWSEVCPSGGKERS